MGRALLAAIPLLALLILLGGLRMRSYRAALIGLAIALLLAVTVFGLPAGQAFSSAAEGAAFGLFPIVWIILNAVWLNKLQRATRYFDVIGRTFCAVSGDVRIQALLVAFSFGALIESVSGFGTPIAVTSVMLTALGFTPVRAAVIALFANTAPASFGSVGNPIQTLAKVTAYPADELGAMAGRESAVLALLVPFVLLVLLDGCKGLRELWPAALVAGIGFGGGQLLFSNFFTYQLTNLGAALGSTVALMLLLHFWRPAGERESTVPVRDSRRDIVIAFAPYAILVGLFAVVTFVGPAKWLAGEAGFSFRWPGLSESAGRLAVFDFEWLNSSGTILLVTGVLTAVLLRVSARTAIRSYGQAVLQIRWAMVAIAAVLALAYVMNVSGMALALGEWAAGAGPWYALFSGAIGWFGVALTGSDTSSNALFGAMQIAAAHSVGVSPQLMAVTNSVAGVLGKAVAVQNLALAASAVGLPDHEGELLRKVLGWSLLLLAILCVVVWVLATAVT